MNAPTCIQHMGKARERRQFPHGEATRTPSLLVQRKTLVMIAVQVVIWSWLPILLASMAAQSTGNDIGGFGQFLVPGSAAASVIASIWLFINRMAKAGEENAQTIRDIMASQEVRIKNITESHVGSIQLLADRIEENSSAVREMNQWIRECTQHISRDKS